jgi:ferric-dicitrate binding protein FerR (iron transport regulator)
MKYEITAEALILKLGKGTLSTQERELLEHWYVEWAANDSLDLSEQQLNAALNRLDQSFTDGVERNEPLRIWRPILRIAAIFIFIAFCGILFKYYTLRKEETQIEYAAKILPGKTGATLRLADGRKVNLNKVTEGNVAKLGGVNIKNNNKGQLVYQLTGDPTGRRELNTLSTSFGHQYQLVLPDGTLVWLNAASSLTYPAHFDGEKERKVILSGQAYFEVAKDKNHPFIVSTTGQQVEVLGTHFDICAFPEDKDQVTTLVEGSVKINDHLLKPNQQAIRIKENITVKPVDARTVIAWKDGLFVFNDERLEMVMSKIARWYNVKVTYLEGANKDYLYGGTVSRYDNLSTVLKKLEAAGDMHYEIKNRTIFISK